MRQSSISFALLLLLPVGCAKKPITVQPEPVVMTVEVKAEPSQANVTFRGKIVGLTPQSLGLSTNDDLLSIDASRENDPVIEKRIRFLSLDKTEVVFVFASGQSAMAKALGFPRILVFDYGTGLTFDVNKFDLKPEFLPFLDRQASMLKKFFPGQDVYVCGHTDSTGKNDFNLKLSLDRAQAVSDALTGREIPKSRLKVQGLASQYPVAGNDTPEDRAKNRRTELILAQ